MSILFYPNYIFISSYEWPQMIGFRVLNPPLSRIKPSPIELTLKIVNDEEKCLRAEDPEEAHVVS